jgi:propionyl-CoA synthetase
MTQKIKDFHARSISDRDNFWANEAKLIDWDKPFEQVLDFSNPPFAKWFVNGKTNLCHNAIDRHLGDRANQDAVVYVSTETNEERKISYSELSES